MARKALIEKNKKKIQMSKAMRLKRDALKNSIYDKKGSLQERLSFVQKLSKMPRNSSQIRVRNICSITGRTRGVYRKLGISRHKIRDLCGMLLIPGLTKSSW